MGISYVPIMMMMATLRYGWRGDAALAVHSLLVPQGILFKAHAWPRQFGETTPRGHLRRPAACAPSWCHIRACTPPPRTAQNPARSGGPRRPSRWVGRVLRPGADSPLSATFDHPLAGRTRRALGAPSLQTTVVRWDWGPAGHWTPPRRFHCQANKRGGPLTIANPKTTGNPKRTALARQRPGRGPCQA